MRPVAFYLLRYADRVEELATCPAQTVEEVRTNYPRAEVEAIPTPGPTPAPAAAAEMITCDHCRHWTPDHVNPAAGMGRCGIDPTARARPWGGCKDGQEVAHG